MAITFDAAQKRIILDSTAVTAAETWSRWVDWHALSDNAKYPLAFRQVGGDDLGSGLAIPPYLFLLNGWRVRPMEANHTLIITGNLFVEGGGVPVVPTLGTYNVSVQYTVPVQAQALTSGGGGGSNPWDANLEGALTAKDVMRLLLAVSAGKTIITDTGNGTATVEFQSVDGAISRVTATMAGSERTQVSLSP